MILLIAAHVTQFRERPKRIDHFGRPGVQFLGIGIFEAVLILRATHAILDREILDRLQEQGRALDVRHRRLQPSDDLLRACLSLRLRFQIDEDAAAVEGSVRAIHTDE